MTDSVMPRMLWDDPDLPGAIAIFRQQCDLNFSVKNVRADKQVDHILLFMGAAGLRMYNSWGLTDNKNDPKTVWGRFETQLKPKSNFRVARLYLQTFQQKERESIDDFMSRLKLHAQTCQFRDNTEFSDRVIEQFIAGTLHPNLQKQLLSKDADLTIDQCTDLARTHEAAMVHMQQLANVNHTAVDAVNKGGQHDACGNCGEDHPFLPRERCPAFDKVCNRCGKRNHYGKMCRSAAQSDFSAQGQSQRGRSRWRQPRGRGRGNWSRSRTPSRQYSRDMHTLDDLQNPPLAPDTTADMFEHLSLHALSDGQERRDAFAEVEIRQDNARRIIHLHAKVDTGAQANTIPIRIIYRRMYPAQLDADGFPRAGHLTPTRLS